jgi:UDP-2,4-diacetamido-2,4,6-trideoxy-beta-L-altropyranose hydrolase
MLNNSIFFRVDGNDQIGFGHIVRCLSLAQILKKNYSIHFVCMTIPFDFILELKNESFAISIIKQEKDIYKLIKLNDIIVIDHYELDSKYQKELKAIGCKVVCIDDLNNKKFYADLIINQSPIIKKKEYRAEPYTNYALGFDYILLRREFFEKSNEKKLNNSKNVFICFGGADTKLLSHYFAELCYKTQYFDNIFLVGNKVSEKSDTNFSKKNKTNVKLMKNLRASEIINYFNKSLFAIVPSSNLTLEALATKTYVLSILNAENQINIFNSIKNLNSVKTINTLDCDKYLKQNIISETINYFENVEKASFPEFNQGKIIEKFQTL